MHQARWLVIYILNERESEVLDNSLRGPIIGMVPRVQLHATAGPPFPHPAFGTATDLLCQAFQEQPVHRTLGADMEFADLALGKRDQLSIVVFSDPTGAKASRTAPRLLRYPRSLLWTTSPETDGGGSGFNRRNRTQRVRI